MVIKITINKNTMFRGFTEKEKCFFLIFSDSEINNYCAYLVITTRVRESV